MIKLKTPKLKRFDLTKQSEMTLFKSMFSAYLKEVCLDDNEYQQEIDDLNNEKLTRQLIDQTLQKHDQYFIMQILLDKVCIGFIGYSFREKERSGFINNFYICPEYRNAGIGSSVYSMTETHLKELGASFIELDPVKNARLFYERNGFALSHTASNGETVFRKTLKK